jgi:hypothetical protein
MRDDRRTVASLLLVALLTASQGCAPPRPTLPAGRPRFVACGDGTVCDGATGLVWSQSANLPGFTDRFDGLTWDDALAFVAAMNAGTRPNMGRTDWRLPERDELRRLFAGFWVRRDRLYCWSEAQETGCRTRASNDPFVELSDRAYWSATVHPDDDGVWVVEPVLNYGVLPKRSRLRFIPVSGPTPSGHDDGDEDRRR